MKLEKNNHTGDKKHILSKSTFIRGLQCHKSLYLNRYRPELRNEIDPKLQQAFDRGSELGVYAQKLFPGGTDASPETPFKYQESVRNTAELVAGGVPVIYEAAFQYDGVLSAIDILVFKDGEWNAYEVKSSTGVSDTYILDAALQYYVMVNSGIPLRDIFIVHVNNQYIRHGDIDVFSLFMAQSVLGEVLERQEFIAESIVILKQVLKQKQAPAVDIGLHCGDPYDCDFKAYCWRHIPENSIFDIAGLHKKKMFELYNDGIVRLEDIPNDYKLNDAQRLQVECYMDGHTHIDSNAIRSFINELSYPLYFMDFETFNPAIPLFDNSRPYQQIPFQYSLHYMSDKDAELRHYEFLAEADGDPRRNFIEQLLHDTKRPDQILVYNQQFEIMRLKELAELFQEYSADIEKLISRVMDLMQPFRNKHYYSPSMNGSYSIKKVLPALVPDLSYDTLAISNGGMAMNAFEELLHEPDAIKRREMRNNLLEYCKMDTMAMVRILRKLEDIAHYSR